MLDKMVQSQEEKEKGRREGGREDGRRKGGREGRREEGGTCMTHKQ